MNNNDFIKLVSGMGTIAQNSAKEVEQSINNYIEQNFLKGKYVLREEYDQLKNIVIKLQNRVSLLEEESKDSNNTSKNDTIAKDQSI